MNFALAVYGAPYSSQASSSALRFARAVTAAGHEIERVFFYHDGVSVANDSIVAPQDEVDLPGQWTALACEHKFELAVCIAASLKRGVVNETEQQRYETPNATLKPGFEIVGLGQLVDAVINADRLVTFAA
jgi:tRNA 2-thiouridine synthesizing protein D